MRSFRKPFRTTLRTALAIGLLSIMHVVHGQQEVMISQYMFNGLFLNPAYAGSHPYMSGSLLHRAQWIGIDGAPNTSTLAIDGPLLGEKMGLGFTLVHDRIGVSRDMEMAGQYAYRIRTGDRGRLAFGLKAGLSLYSARLNDLIYWDSQDVLYQQNISNAVLGKFGFGMYWHDDRSYVGLALPTLYAADKNISRDLNSGTAHYFTQHYYLNAGHVFELTEDLDLKPSLLIKYEQNAPPQVDLNANVLFRDRFWLGAGYRTGDALVCMVEYRITPMFRAGYAYDMTTSRLGNYTAGSHEVMLGVELGRDPIKIKTPRYF
jgi:type IX secretion system PorP/SprF family membrane protein